MQRDPCVLLLSLLLAVCAFLLDLKAPHGAAVGVFYLVPVVVCLRASNPAYLLRIALLSTFLAVVGFLVTPPAEFWIPLSNRFFALAVIWTTTLLTIRYRRSETARIEEQKAATARLSQVLEGAPDAMIITDGEGIIREVNSTGEQMFGYARGEIIVQPVEQLVPRPLRTRHRAHRQDYYRNPKRRAKGVGMMLKALRKDGSEIPIEVTLSTLETEDGINVISAVRDVSDTGEGMTDEVKARLFEPFFTTKHAKGGSGLGLAVCYGIVKQAGGYIYVYRDVGKGSTFKVYFPRVTLPAEPDAPPAQLPAVLGGTETILLVEDEAAVRALAVRTLEQAGYTVLESESGHVAIGFIENDGQPIALMLTDVVLRDMNGRDLSERIDARRPGTPVIFMSGYTDNVIARNGVLEAGIVFLQKPFKPETLLRKLRTVLDADTAPA